MKNMTKPFERERLEYFDDNYKVSEFYHEFLGSLTNKQFVYLMEYKRMRGY